MFEVGEFIVHPGQGVCRVEAIDEGASASYKLMPVAQRHPMLISYPVSGESRLRPIVSHAEAKSLIEGYADIDPDLHTDRSSALEEEYFKGQIKHGTCLDSVRVAKTFRRRIAQVRANNKKPPVSYERILKEAQDRSVSELSVALGCSTDDVRDLFQQHGADEML